MLYIRWSRGGSCARANTEAHKEFLVLTETPRRRLYHYSRSFALKKKNKKKKKRRDKKEEQD